ncbi:MAG: DUF3828 domain-containing protein [Pyrinomonadaceae bacterium]|nr:DUF3828 domain-containing protein [Pyrinomonadaceae bacterium]
MKRSLTFITCGALALYLTLLPACGAGGDKGTPPPPAANADAIQQKASVSQSSPNDSESTQPGTGEAEPSPTPAPGKSPAADIRDLYRVHDNGNGPVFDRAGRRYLVKYFNQKLADLLWKDIAETPEDEVGNLDFDPLYNAQDTEITNFRVGEPVIEGDKAVVSVSFNNYGQRTKINFKMVSAGEDWKIENINYEGGSNLIKILSAP